MNWTSYPRTGDRGGKSIRFTVGVPEGVTVDRLVALVTGPGGELREWELDQLVRTETAVSGRRLHALDGSDFLTSGSWEVALWAYSGGSWVADHYTTFDVLPGVDQWP